MSGRLSVHHRRPSALCLYRRDRRERAVSDPRLCRRIVPMTEESEVGTLVQASAKGDEAAWNALVRRYAPLVLAVIRNYQLAAADVQDVSQTVWLRLVEHLADLRAPEALPGWLVTTTQRECSPLPAAGAEDPAGRSAQRRHREAGHHRGPRPRHPAGRTPPGAARRAGGTAGPGAAAAAAAGRRPAQVLSGDQRADRDADRKHRPEPAPEPRPAPADQGRAGLPGHQSRPRIG